MWRLCEAGRFSYGESPRTPPLEGTSLHRRHNSVERPWGILSLFYDLFPITSEFILPEADTNIIICICRLYEMDRFSYAGRGGGNQLFPITNGCHTSTWHTSELNNDHVLGNNT